MSNELLAALAGELTPGGPGGEPTQLRLRQGTIVSVQSNGTATVTIGGDTTEISGVKAASHVCPVPNATCWLAVDGRDAFIIATLAPAGPAFGRMRQNTAQSVGNNLFTQMSFTSRTAVRTQGLTDGNNGFTVIVPGWYRVSATVAWNANATGRRGIQILCGGSVYFGGNILQTSAAGTSWVATSGLVEAAAGDLIAAEILQQSGGALSTAVGPGLSLLDAVWVRPIET